MARAIISEERIRSISDGQLQDLVQVVVAECRRRGEAALTPLRQSLTAVLAAQQVREEQEVDQLAAEKSRQDQAKALRRAERLRDWAQRARRLFGHAVPKYDVTIWIKGADIRVYIGHGYNHNWVEYYHSGNARVLPGTIKFLAAVDKTLATQLGCTREEAAEQIKEYCAMLAERNSTSLTLEVTELNAPRDPACHVTRWVLKTNENANMIKKFKPGVAPVLADCAQEALHFATEEEALAALEAAKAQDGKYLDNYTPVTKEIWLFFPPTP